MDTEKNRIVFLTYKALVNDSKIKTNKLIEKLNIFCQYLSELCSQVSHNTFKQNFIYQQIFKNTVNSKDADLYVKSNLIAASESIKRMVSKIDLDGINGVIRKILIDFICDLKPFIKTLDIHQDYNWLVCNPNVYASNFYYDLSNNIFWKGKPDVIQEERNVLSASTPFIIRQAIEYKIKRILGIDYIHKNGIPQKTDIKIYFEAFKLNKEYYHTRNFDIDIIKIIHKWTNYYIHGGYRAHPWVVETALFCLREFFYVGETSDKKSKSVFASVEVKESDLDDLRENTAETIKSKLEINEIIKWLPNPEVVITKSVKK